MKNKVITQEYYVIERNNKFFGIEYEDGKCTCEGFIEPYEEGEYFVNTPMEKVKKINEHTKSYIDENGISSLTYEGNKRRFLEQIENSKLRKVRVTTTIEYID